MIAQLQRGVMRVGYRTLGGVDIAPGQVVQVSQFELSGLVILRLSTTGEDVYFCAHEVDIIPLQPHSAADGAG